MRFGHMRNDEAFMLPPISLITADSLKPNCASITSKGVRSSHAISRVRDRSAYEMPANTGAEGVDGGRTGLMSGNATRSLRAIAMDTRPFVSAARLHFSRALNEMFASASNTFGFVYALSLQLKTLC